LLDSPHPEVQRIARMSTSALRKRRRHHFLQSDMVDFLRGDQIQTSIARTSFDLRHHQRRAVSIYLIMPLHMLESHSRLLRLWLGALISCIIAPCTPRHATLFILDEAAQLGELPHLRQAITLLRGYGLQTWTFGRNVSQLQMLYSRDWKTMVNNAGASVLRPAQPVAADTMAEMTAFVAGMRARPRPERDVLQLGGDEAVVAQLPNYLADPAFHNLMRPQSDHDQDRP